MKPHLREEREECFTAWREPDPRLPPSTGAGLSQWGGARGWGSLGGAGVQVVGAEVQPPAGSGCGGEGGGKA